MVPHDAPRFRGEATSEPIVRLSRVQSAVADAVTNRVDEGLSSGGDLAERKIPSQREGPPRQTSATMDAYSDTRVHFKQRLLDDCHAVLLEDDDEALEILGQILETLGAKTERYADPLELLSKSNLDADILISDVSLPHMTGLELIRQLRTQGYSRPAVALTAHDSRRDQLTSLRAGFTVHLTKPVDRELLVATVAALLGRFEA